jgi:hypothetical protein
MTRFEDQSEAGNRNPSRCKRTVTISKVEKRTTKTIVSGGRTSVRTVSRKQVKRIEESSDGFLSEASAERPHDVPRSAPSETASALLGSLPTHFKLSIRGVTDSAGRVLQQVDGDYILGLVYQDASFARWEHVFSPHAGLFRASIQAEVRRNEWSLTAQLAGIRGGPTWSCCDGSVTHPVALSLDARSLRRSHRQAVWTRLSWPDRVDVFPIGSLREEDSGDIVDPARTGSFGRADLKSFGSGKLKSTGFDSGG